MSIFWLASLGGLISFASTGLGALLSSYKRKGATTNRWNLSVDFALGLMVSASAFSLIGPVALESKQSTTELINIAVAVLAGGFFVYLCKEFIEFRRQNNLKSGAMISSASTAELLLASVLMLHNFPEGLASGAALAGLGWHASLPILTGISIQNVPEGALMVLCLKAMGWSPRNSLLGGLASGGVEMVGGMLAGVLLQLVTGVLPLLLSFAGGAMIVSVLVELLEGQKQVMRRVWSYQFLIGFLALPLLKLLGF